MMEHATTTQICPHCGTSYTPLVSSADCPQCSQSAPPEGWDDIDDGWELEEEGAEEEGAEETSTGDLPTEQGAAPGVEGTGNDAPRRARRTRSKGRRGKPRPKVASTTPGPDVAHMQKPKRTSRPATALIVPATKKKPTPPWLIPVLVFLAALLIGFLAIIASRA